ncbi:MAG TPA: single-stranded-DNA-specific exonuclease RecJ [Chloroflexia bacterium]|nr:single-stranded-DNA-specific exonuclease RecJ [Chloroflexia bacterium]
MEAPPKRWKKRQSLKPEQIAELQEALADHKLTPLLLQLLVNRKVIDPRALHAEPEDDHTPLPPQLTVAGMQAAVAAFLNPTATPLPPPATISGMAEAVDRMARAIKDKETIAVYGDYDADGVTSTVLLTQALRAFGATVVIHVPHRKREGYGLNKAALDSLADQGATLVVTVDCGISNADEVTHGQARGLDLIVTDHHALPKALPNTILINPKQGGEGDPFYWLTGVGVAHQVVRALVERLGKPPGRRNNDLLELVAIGTVADIAPLHGANRALVALGINCLRATRRPGLLALLEAAALKPAAIGTHSIGYVIAPRINAAGRLDDAKMAYDLLLTEDRAVAADLARQLEAENQRRQEITRGIQDEARKQVAALEQDAPIIILRDKTWDVGVAGLVAGRLCDEFARPVIVLVDEGETSRGSARSTPHFDIHALLTECEDLLGHYGGHPGAAGLSLPNANFDEFCERMGELVESEMTDPSQLSAELHADAELPLTRVTLETVAELSALEPFGHENKPPLFVARNLRVVDSKANGKDGRTLCIQVTPPDSPGPTLRAVGFGQGQEWMPRLAAKPKVDVMYEIKVDEWNGQQRVELEIKGLRLSKE